jgi:3-deoxy-D-manno-octulosonic-acid transferase
MNALYNLTIFAYSVLIRIAAPFNIKAKQLTLGRKRAFPDLEKQIKHDKPIIWVHCASLGEFEQGRPLIEAIKTQHPEYQILLTFFSPSGYEIRKNYNLADYVAYLPADTPKNAKRLISMVNPEKVFFVKYEFWHHYITELKKQNIPLYLVSAIFRDNQLFFKNSVSGKWYRKMLFGFEHLFVQDQHSVDLLKSIGVNNATKAGDTRFDRVAAIARTGKTVPLIEKFKGANRVVVVGSSWRPDEDLLVQYINQHPEIKFIIAPHEIKEPNIERLTGQLDNRWARYTKTTENEVINKQVLIIDTIGLLSTIYRYAEVAYIGGGFGVGIHNTLEAAIFNIPVVFGPNYNKFNEAVSMAQKGIAYPITTYAELENVFDRLLSDPERRKKIAAESAAYTSENVGATQLILQKVF